ncbi:aminotransferase class IV [Frondihabitans sp. PAMC 28766]|uniref:aminotransferase class IV n=1 Tax=Frondihabitans sp. PAMC 28766 TaxID=1795630 RepID=UPI001EF70B7B|nr:aminotransferase class IV [Frondihabitans sp. PAMC 28766]
MLIDGAEATSAALLDRLNASEGHRTALQVRAGRVRGLDLHFQRLDQASRALFGAPAPLTKVVEAAIRVLGTAPNEATLRIEIFADPAGHQHVLVEAGAASPRDAAPHRLELVRHDRLLPGIEHTALGSPQVIDRLSRRAGFDGAVLVSSSGHVVEIADGTLGLISGRRVVWPDGPALASLGRGLLEPQLAAAGIATVVLPVRAGDLGLFDGAFVVCARGAARVEAIGDVTWPHADHGGGSILERVLAAHEIIPTESLSAG